MEGRAQLERRIDLPRAIVWDALVDPVLVEGWLHPTVRLIDGVAELIEPAPEVAAVLDTVVDPFGALRFELGDAVGGTRGTSTMLRLRVESLAGWSDRLDDLENLLRGHPVDWGGHSAGEQRA